MKYRNNPNAETLSEIETTLNFIREHSQGLTEKPGDSKWTDGHTVFCLPDDEPGMYSFMVGALKDGKVTWHMMPMYGVEEMKQKWSDALKPFVSGKSCINFRHFADLPQDALLDIVSNGPAQFADVMRIYNEKRKRGSKKSS